MPGFGSGSFGSAAFGQFNWSRRVLYESAPEIYRTEDAANDYTFLKYAEAQGVSFDNLRLKIAALADLRDPRRVRTRYNETTTLRLGSIEPVRGPVEQKGVLAYVSGIGVFTAPRARFSFDDVGKEITVINSTIATNNATVVITNIVSPTEVLTNPPYTPDTGTLKWELRAQDATAVDGTLVTVVAGDVSIITPGWILSDGFADFTVLSRTQFKPESEEWKLLTLREGTDGSIASTLRFSSPTLALTSEDVGRKLTIANTANPAENSGRFEIVDVLSSTECILDSTDLVAEPTGTLVWALLRTPELLLEGSATLKGHVEQKGKDGEIISVTSRFSATSASFTTEDVGKYLTIHEPGYGYNGTYEIESYLSDTLVQLDGSFGADTTGLYWELRDGTDIGDETQVEARAPNLIQYLAQDHGIELDNREDEEWQRRWIESVPRWTNMKGHENAYKYLAELTGFTAIVTALYRVSQDNYEDSQAAGAQTYAVGEAEEGRYGSDGSLNVVGGYVRFSSPTFVIENWDEGRQIEVSGTSGGTNDGLRTIVSDVTFEGDSTVQFRAVDTMTGASDANNGAIVWRIVRLYADQAPTLPVHDEINSDLMVDLKGTSVFTVDKYCWEQLPSPWSTLIGAGDGLIAITEVDPSGASAFPTTYTVKGRGDFDVVTGLGVGRWKLTDNSTEEHFLETVPEFPTVIEGVDGELERPSLINYLRASGGFGETIAGQVVQTRGAALPENNTLWYITAVGSTYLALDAVHGSLTDDPNNGSIEYEVYDPDSSGKDGSFIGTDFNSPGSPFTANDVGKKLYVSNTGSNNNAIYTITTYVDADNVKVAESFTAPDANNGSIVWAVIPFEFQVIATDAPATGTGTLEYICSEQIDCAYCKSNKVHIEATTPYLLEKMFERLRNRLVQVKPAHVEIVENYGVTATASLSLTAEVDSP